MAEASRTSSSPKSTPPSDMNQPEVSDAYWSRLASVGPFRVFTRNLDNTEASFYWDSEFSGTSDVIQCTTIRVEPSLQCSDPSGDAARFRNIWLHLKRRFPILSSRIDELNEGNTLRFVVSEERLQEAMIPNEFEFFPDATEATLNAVRERGLNSPVRRLSAHMNAALSVLSRSDKPAGTYDFVWFAAHTITDAMACLTCAHTLCDVVSRWPVSMNDPIPALEDALAMIPSSESLHPTLKLPLARRRWRRAAARIIDLHRAARLVGGQTLPRIFSAHTLRTPACSRILHRPLPLDISRSVIAACRTHGVTVGHTLPVLGQVALSRILHRRLAQGDLSLEEWQHRKREPTMTFSPLNLRSFLDSEWIEKGGFDAVNIYVSHFVETLPCLPRAPLRNPRDEISFDVDASGAPPLHKLLSRSRFWHRAALGKRTLARYHRHPLFLELCVETASSRAASARATAEIWRRVRVGEDVPIVPLPKGTRVPLHGGSSVGNVEHLMPTEYPIHSSPSSTHKPEPTLQRDVSSILCQLRCRPAQLYLGAVMYGGALQYFVYYDANVYTGGIVEEWLDEVAAAATYFLSESEEMQESGNFSLTARL